MEELGNVLFGLVIGVGVGIVVALNALQPDYDLTVKSGVDREADIRFINMNGTSHSFHKDAINSIIWRDDVITIDQNMDYVYKSTKKSNNE
tara:strand:- start:1123 stop:1395 length:273 start_codon:yes stop_codon:yes gene_type:complete